MKPVVTFIVLSLSWCALGLASAGAQVLKAQRLAILTPAYEMAEYRFQDLNRDRYKDLLVVGREGQIEVWSGNGPEEARFTEVGPVWSLPFPRKSLLSLSSFSFNGEDMYLITLTPDGLFAYPVHPDGGIDPNGILVNRRIRFFLGIGRPVFSRFLQDINQDGQLDILVPGMDTCEIWINEGASDNPPTSDKQIMPQFSRMGRFPIKITHRRSMDMQNTPGQLSEQFIIPGLLLKDVNGDQHLDLVVEHEPQYDYYLLDAEGRIPDKPTVSLDLTLFQDTTPKSEGIPFGETYSPNNGPQLNTTDLNNDQIPDYVIFHRRKLWFFLGTPNGPQFTNPGSILKIADDISFFMPCLLDDDAYPDLLMLKLQIPTISQILGALFTDWDIKVESIGYRSKQGRSFELSSNWQGDVFLRLPSILSLINRPDRLKDFQPDLKYGSAVHGDFNGDGRLDIAMTNRETGDLDIWLGKEGDQVPSTDHQDADKELGEKIRKLLFTKSDNVWDLDRIKKALNSLINQQVFAVTGGEPPDVHLTEAHNKPHLRVSAVDFDHDDKNELLFVSADPKAGQLTRFELYALTGN